MRTITRDLLQHVGERVEVEGWLHKKRLMGGLNFLVLRDRAGLVQILDHEGKEADKLNGLQNGTVMKVSGTVVADERAVGGVEIHQPQIEVVVPVSEPMPIEIDKPLSHKSENLDTLFDNRPIALRNLREAAIFRVQAKTLTAFRDYFAKHDFTEINSPKLLAEATEGGAETFKLDYFGKTATLAQSAQFYKQMMVGVFERVFETNPTYRAEPSATTRHMTEYITVDAEMGFIGFDDLLNFVGGGLVHVANYISQHCAEELKAWQVEEYVLPKDGADIPRLTITQIHEMFRDATGEDHTEEDDLAPAEEKWICEYAKKELKSEAVFVTGWSSKSKTFKFYHRANAENPELADRADLLFRGVEITTLSMRENRYDVLVEQLRKNGGDPESAGYAPLLSAYKHGMPPHGGFGWGLERTVEKLLGLNNIKEAALFPRDMQRLAP
ncbi:aspartate--tRNA(Asn) ligase [bacterium]|nr:aspartate--tRNA(Asn) ligase [bacterium]